jgi:aminoglycoside 6'-N-acetyltransferase
VGALIAAQGAHRIRRMQDCEEDYALLARWLTDPRVLEFYEGRDNPFPLERVRAKYAPRVLAEEAVVTCILEYAGRPAGYLQFYPADPAEYQFAEVGRAWALDLFIGEPELWNQGHGTAFTRLVLRRLFEREGAGWVLIDPHVDNPRAARAYEKAGFRKVKLLPAHELHEGRMADCWLMAASAADPDL